jgi:hypothetical protein
VLRSQPVIRPLSISVLAWIVGCSRPAATVSVPTSSAESAVLGPDAATLPKDSQEAGDAKEALETGAPSGEAPRLSPAQAAEILFAADGTALPSCDGGDEAARVECSIAARFVSDGRAVQVAKELYARTGDLAGLSPRETMEGGWRGTLHLVPTLPIGKERNHLEWISEATRDYDAFFEALTDGTTPRLPYVWRGLAFRFMRSVGARTPSAYALLDRREGPQVAGTSVVWTIAYNVEGSLNKSQDAVRELVFHENFHLNDQNHGDWSVRVLGPTFDAIVGRCGTKMACLTPYTPTEMTVRGGTYYAFQPNNGAAVREYAAELALRYYREQRAYSKSLPHPKRFKCGTKENALAWKLLVNEFFGAIDHTPACE